MPFTHLECVLRLSLSVAGTCTRNIKCVEPQCGYGDISIQSFSWIYSLTNVNDVGIFVFLYTNKTHNAFDRASIEKVCMDGHIRMEFVALYILPVCQKRARAREKAELMVRLWLRIQTGKFITALCIATRNHSWNIFIDKGMGEMKRSSESVCHKT